MLPAAAHVPVKVLAGVYTDVDEPLEVAGGVSTVGGRAPRQHQRFLDAHEDQDEDGEREQQHDDGHQRHEHVLLAPVPRQGRPGALSDLADRRGADCASKHFVWVQCEADFIHS